MPAFADSAAILLYSSAARFTSSIVGFLGPLSVAVIIWVIPTSCAQAMDSACFVLSSFMPKWPLTHVKPWSARIFFTCLPSLSGAKSS